MIFFLKYEWSNKQMSYEKMFIIFTMNLAIILRYALCAGIYCSQSAA